MKEKQENIFCYVKSNSKNMDMPNFIRYYSSSVTAMPARHNGFCYKKV